MKPGQTLRDRYTLCELLGSSDAGRTWRAVDGSDGTDVVLKVLDFARLKGWNEFELFQREVELLKSIEHPSIPRYVDDFGLEMEGDPYLVLVQRHVPGEDLERRVRAGRRFELREIRAIVRRILETLRYVHGLRPPVVHRDIHPRNIVLADRGKAYLVDFGAAGGVLGASITGDAPTSGVIGYVPPEQYLGQSTAASDLYALGMCAVFLLTGREPSELTEDELRRAYREAAAPDSRLLALLDGLTQSDLAKRTPTAVRALELLGRAPRTVPAAAEMTAVATARKTRGGWLAAAVVAAVLVVVVGLPAIGAVLSKAEAARLERDRPLIEAMQTNLSATGRMQTVQRLVQEGADPDARDGNGRTALVIALQEGHPDIARYLLDAGADPLAHARRAPRRRTTPLHAAAGQGYAEFVREMLAAGIAPDALDDSGRSALHLAVWGGHGEVARILVERGSDVNLPDHAEDTPLAAAVDAREPAIARLLLEAGATPSIPVLADALEAMDRADDPGAREVWRGVAEHMVSAGCDIHAVDERVTTGMLLDAAGDPVLTGLLLGTQTDVNAAGGSGSTALMRAARRGDTGAVDILLDLGADKDLENEEGQTALSLARVYGHAGIADRLKREGAAEVATEASFFAAVTAGDIGAVRSIVRAGVDVNAQRARGYGLADEQAVDIAVGRGDAALLQALRDLGAKVSLTPTMLLNHARAGNLAAVSLLLASGVNRDVRTRSGETALDLAIDAGHVDVALVLRRAGAEGEVTADTLVGYARGGRVASLRVLLALGVPAEQRDAGGRSALMEASRWGKTDAVRLLLDAGADPDRVDSRGRRPLLVAADWDQLPAVDLLLARGADVNAQDPGGATALHQAAAGGNPDIARVLLRYRADTGIKDTDGDTPLVAAVLGREPDLVRLLIASGCDVNEPTVARRATGNQTTPLGIAVWMHSRYSSDEDTAAVEDLLRAAGARE